MGPKFDHLPTTVAAQLRQYYRRTRALRVLRVAYAALVLYALLILVAVHLDRFLFLGTGTRVLMFWAAHGIAGVFAAARLVLLLHRPTTAREVAYELESKLSPGVEERYVTLENVLEHGGFENDPIAAHFVEHLKAATASHSQRIKAARLVKDRPLRRLARVLMVVGLVYGLLALPASYEFLLMLRRFYSPRAPLPKASFVKLSVTPQEIVVGKGGEVIIEAEVHGDVPALLRWLMTKLGTSPNRCLIAVAEGRTDQFDFGDGELLEMNRIHRRLFLSSRSNLQESFAFRVRCGDAQTEARIVRVIAQPRVVDVTLTVTPPAYCRLPVETIEGAQDKAAALRFLPGSQIKLAFRTDRAVVERVIRIEGRDEPVEPQWDEPTLTATHEFVLKQKVAMEITIVDRYGFANVERTTLVIDLREDIAPTVRLEFPTGELEKVPGEFVAIQAQVEDDLGVEEVAISFMLNPDREAEAVPQEVAVPLDEKGRRNLSLAAVFDLGKTGAIPGDVLVARVRARDSAGSDGFSPQILIRVVPFTRGENERRRLAALELVKVLMERLGSPPKDEAQGAAPFAIDEDLYHELAGVAAKLDVGLADEASVESVLSLLEREGHFTDAPRHKEDVRKLRGVILYACAPFGANVEDAQAFRAQRFREVADVLPPVTGLRRLKNITWRLFGMRYEAGNIAERFDRLAEQKKRYPDQLKSITRRAELYLQTLQDIGDDLIRLSRETPALEEAKVKEIAGELNTAGYYMKTGSLAARRTSCRKVQELLSANLALVRGAFVPLLEEEIKARARLDATYGECLARVPGASGAQRDAVARWLAEDGRLLTWNPFAPLWPRLTNFALRRGLPADRAAQRMKPDANAQLAIRQERLAAGALAFQWESESVLSLASISNTEKALELRLLALERAASAGALTPQALARSHAELTATDLSETMDDASFAAAAERHRRDTPAALQEAVARQRTNTGLLAGHARLLLAFRTPAEELADVVARFDETEAALKQAGDSLGSGKSETLGADVTKLVAALAREVKAMHGAAEALYLQLALVQEPAGAEASEVMMLKLRETASRYSVRLDRAAAGLWAFAAGAGGAQDLTGLSGDLEQLRFLHGATRDSLRKLLAAAREGKPLSEEERKKYLLLEEFRRTERYLATASVMLDGKGDAATVREFLEAFPEAGLFHLVAHTDLVVRADRAVREAEAELKGSPPQVKRFAERLGQGRALLVRFRDVVAQAGPGEHQERIGAKVAQILNRLERLEPRDGSDRTSDAQVSRSLFALSEVRKALAALDRDLAGIAEQTEAAQAGFRGGPDDIWTKPYRYQAEKTRQRLLAQGRHARGHVFEGVLEALQDKPDARRHEEGHAWSVFLYRLVRSELCGVGGIKPPGAGEGRKADPHLAFLQAELAKALQVNDLKHYAEPTKEYLETVRDFLRY